MDKQKLYIVLPNRIGDTILTIPALFTLKQNTDIKNNYEVTLVCSSYMYDFVKQLDLFYTEKLSLISKLKTWLQVPDIMFSYLSSTLMMGYHSKYSYGWPKRIIKYDKNIPCLIENNCNLFPYKSFYQKLKYNFGCSDVTINNFVLCFELGIKEDEMYSSVSELYKNTDADLKGEYFIACMEAGYNKKHTKVRRWNEDNFQEIAEFIYEKFKIKTVFIGMNKQKALPEKDYIIDKRKYMSITDMSKIISKSCGYFGNDTGPLHLANFFHKFTIGIYLEARPKEYGPVYACNNLAFYKPSSLDEVKDEIYKEISSRLNKK